jgi:hypothetical protein
MNLPKALFRFASVCFLFVRDLAAKRDGVSHAIASEARSSLNCLPFAVIVVPFTQFTQRRPFWKCYASPYSDRHRHNVAVWLTRFRC